MTVAHRLESQQISGLLTGFVGVDLPFATVGDSLRMTRVDLRVTDAPSGGTVVAMVNSVTGGGGSALLQGTIADGTRHISVTGDIAISGGTTLYLRVVSESGGALGLSASVELSLPTGGSVTAFLTTLQRVKDTLAISTSGDDTLLTRHLEGVSKGMQNWMARDIVETTYTAERHHPTGLSTAIVLQHGPVGSVSEVRNDGTALAASDYRIEGRMLRRVSGNQRLAWERDAEIEVDYTAGWASVPADLVEAATQETARRWLQSVAGRGAGPHVTAVTPETGNTKSFVPGGWLPETIEAMRSYRRLL